jgi:transcriptional regulator with XRE-family HTH domain
MEMKETENEWFSDAAATFGDRLAGARENAGLDQQDLAVRIGVDIETLIAWEDDIREPRASRVQMLSGILGVTLGWLITGEGDGPGAPPDDAARENAPARQLLRAMVTELHELQGQIAQTAKRIGRIEKRLQAQLASA